MALDFQQIRQKVIELGEKAVDREQHLETLREKARELLENYAHDLGNLRKKVQQAVQHDPSLRCALPLGDEEQPVEPLNAVIPLPPLPKSATFLAVDGSQINPDRHAEIDYGLINIGAIKVRHNSPDPPQTFVECELFYGEQLYTPTGTLSEDMLALMRDLKERSILEKIAAQSASPVITLTDGPLELWGVKESGNGESSEYKKSLNLYLKTLTKLCELDIITAGYVVKPGANLVVRLLEIAETSGDLLSKIKARHPLRGVTEMNLYHPLLQPGDRSCVYAMQSQSAKFYAGELALHFFYLNVGRRGHPSLARVEIPGWVARNPEMLNNLHAALVYQCRIMGSRPYPYLLHRAHETAVVSLEEKEQVTQMIILELRRRGVSVGEQSNKQSAKSLSGRTSYAG